MMLRSNAATKDFRSNGLLAGLGDTLLDQSLAYNWLAHVNDTAPPTPTTEWTAYYGPGGTYSQQESVKTAAADTAYDGGDVPNESGPVNLYVAMQCGPSDPACIAENERKQLANLQIIDNARRAFNLLVCQHNDRLNPGASDCSQYNPVPVAQLYDAEGDPLPMAMVSPSGGQYSIPIGGETAAQLQARTQAWTARQDASATANQPNRSVLPQPQGGITAAELAAILSEQNKGAETGFSLVGADGKILGLDPMILAVVAMGVGALLLLKK